MADRSAERGRKSVSFNDKTKTPINTDMRDPLVSMSSWNSNRGSDEDDFTRLSIAGVSGGAPKDGLGSPTSHSTSNSGLDDGESVGTQETEEEEDDMITVRAHNKKTGEITIMRVRKGTPMKEVMSKYAQNKGVKAERLSWKRRASVRESVVVTGTVPGTKAAADKAGADCGYTDCGCTGYGGI